MPSPGYPADSPEGFLLVIGVLPLILQVSSQMVDEKKYTDKNKQQRPPEDNKFPETHCN
jgi:hypothetical protein